MLRIKELRTEQNWSQRELAAKINANQKTVNLWERGLTEPSAGFVTALADAFECSADYLLGREDDVGRVTVVRNTSKEEENLLSRYQNLNGADRATVSAMIDFLLAKERER